MIDPADLGPLVPPQFDRPTTEQEAARAFELIFVESLLKQFRSAMPGGSGHFGALAGLMDRALAEKIVEGGGLGFAESLERRLGGPSAPELPPAPAEPLRLPASALARHAPHEGPEAHDPVLRELASQARLTSAFGPRLSPIDGRPSYHSGVDLASPEGSPVRAVRAGTVTFSGSRGGYGNLVIVDHGDGLETRYAHCADLWVREGDRVEAGDRLGSVGSTGRSTGPHLHLEVRRHGEALDPLDLFPELKP